MGLSGIEFVLMVMTVCVVLYLFKFFPQAVDEHFPLDPPKYTRFVYSGCPWSQKIWMKLFGPLYIRVPYGYAEKRSKMSAEEEARSKKQKSEALLKRVMERIQR